MSETLTKIKSKTGQDFLSIMDRSSPARQAKKAKSGAKDRMGTALTALAPWYEKAKVFGAGKVKTEGALGWPAREHAEFTTQIKAMEAAKKADDYQGAAALAETARTFAEAADAGKQARVALAGEFAAAAQAISTISPPPPGLQKRLAAELEEDQRGGDPAAILTRVKQIIAEAGALAPKGARTGQPVMRDTTPRVVDLTRTADDLKADKMREAERKFLNDYRAVENALDRLSDMVAPAIPALGTAVAAAKAKTIDGQLYDKADATIATMLRHVEAARAEAEAAAKAKSEVLTAEIKTLRAELTKQASTHARTKNAYAALIAELDGIAAAARTGNVAAIGAGAGQLTSVREAGIVAAPAVARFNATVDAIDAVTAAKAVQTEFQSDGKDITLAVRTVVDTLSLHELPAAQRSVSALEKDALSLNRRTQALGPWRADMEKRLEALGGMVKEFHKLMPKAKNTTFEQGYNEAKSLYDKPGVDRAAVKKLVDSATAMAWPVINNLREAGPGQARAINAVEADRKAGQAALDGKQAKADAASNAVKELEDGLKLLKADLKTAGDQVKATPLGDTEELAELKTLAAQAQKKFDAKPQDLDGARSQSKAVRKRLDALLLTPGGVTATSVAELEKVETLWTAAYEEARKLLERIAAAAGPAAEAARLKPDDVKARTDGLLARFQPFKATLVRSMKLLADPKTPLLTRKAERELALRDVRAIRAILDGNVEAAKLTANPFGIAAPFAAMRRFLASMEYNALRAVPPE